MTGAGNREEPGAAEDGAAPKKELSIEVKDGGTEAGGADGVDMLTWFLSIALGRNELVLIQIVGTPFIVFPRNSGRSAMIAWAATTSRAWPRL
jgi:hypothetical protein